MRCIKCGEVAIGLFAGAAYCGARKCTYGFGVQRLAPIGSRR